MFEQLLLGFSQLATLQGVAVCAVGALLGTVIGVLPGVSAGAMAAMLLPWIPGLPLPLTVVLLASLLYGAQYGGSLGAILLGVPGEASSAITVLDGHALAKRGAAYLTVRAVTIASFVAGILATLVLAGFAVYAVGVIKVSPAQHLVLLAGILGLFVLLSGPRLGRTLLAVAAGLALSLLVANPAAGPGKAGTGIGLDLAAVAVALFGVSEAVWSLWRPAAVQAVMPEFSKTNEALPWRRLLPSSLRGSLIGMLGLIPGFSFSLLTTAAYVTETAVTKRRDFGTGVLEGVVAPEAANNAAGQATIGAFLLLGLPSGPVGAMLVGLLHDNGLEVGPGLMQQAPELVWTVLASFIVVNVLLLGINLPFAKALSSLLRLPRRHIDWVVLTACVVGLGVMSPTITAFGVSAGLCVLALGFRKLQLNLVAVFVGCVLGTLAQAVYQKLGVAAGTKLAALAHDPFVFAPLAIILVGVALRRQQNALAAQTAGV